MGRATQEALREQVRALTASGATDRTASEITGVPVATIRTWRRRGTAPACPDCGGPPHAVADLDTGAYAYLLGMYLGDGLIERQPSGTTRLHVALDLAHPRIANELATAIETICGRRPSVRPDRTGKRCLHVRSTWRSWPCLFPQAGPGRKHTRPIELVPWQREIVGAAPGPLLRGLIHSDGWRGENRVVVKGRPYAYPRYQFSNRSDDIRRIFCDACDALGIAWRPWGRWNISVARRDAVALMDEHVGPKE